MATATPATSPKGEAAIMTVAMPADANPMGDIFGGWLLSQMDIAGGVAASARAKGRTATIGIKEMEFHKPVKVGDRLTCYCDIVRIGRTSLTIAIEAWTTNHYHQTEPTKVTEGVFTYVALDDSGKPRPVPDD
ncbi:MAG: acyl-CoA thioesterase [Rhodospirillaceae bacterium]|jgi:acyl-CoA thioesterase YciA|nr:acyl-CoA thioesterase [Rhodospirillaceae bacterium]